MKIKKVLNKVHGACNTAQGNNLFFFAKQQHKKVQLKKHSALAILVRDG